MHSLDKEEVDNHLGGAIKENAHKRHSSVPLVTHHNNEKDTRKQKSWPRHQRRLGEWLWTRQRRKSRCRQTKRLVTQVSAFGDMQGTYASEDTTSFAMTRLSLFGQLEQSASVTTRGWLEIEWGRVSGTKTPGEDGDAEKGQHYGDDDGIPSSDRRHSQRVGRRHVGCVVMHRWRQWQATRPSRQSQFVSGSRSPISGVGEGEASP